MNNQKLIAALLAVAEQAQNGGLHDDRFGICMNLTVELTGTYRGEEGHEAVAEVAHEFGLDGGYPIPYPDCDPLWRGRQLELRLDFISKMITYLEIRDAQENCTSETI